MPFCTQCGRRCLRDEDKYCFNCGAELHHHEELGVIASSSSDAALSSPVSGSFLLQQQQQQQQQQLRPSSSYSSPLNMSDVGRNISPVLSLRHTHRHFSPTSSSLRPTTSTFASSSSPPPPPSSSSPTPHAEVTNNNNNNTENGAYSEIRPPSSSSRPTRRGASVQFTAEQKQYIRGDHVVGQPEYMPSYCVQCRNVFDPKGEVGTRRCFGQFRRRHPGKVGRIQGEEASWTCCGSQKLNSMHCPRHSNHLSTEWMPGNHSAWDNAQSSSDAFVSFQPQPSF